MRSPRTMRIIQIDITNACDKRCSNCTRFCGHHKKPFFMDFETFKRAIDSLDGYQGIRGIIGGEPTLHPEFERFMEYLGEKFPKGGNPLIRPQRDNDFIQAVHRVELENFTPVEDPHRRSDVVGPGLYSDMGKSYRRHYEIISDVMPFQALNDHLNPIYHQSGMITRKDLGISDEDWPAIRDACRLQNEWSAGITPKGAFFCEMAGVLDMLLDGPGGWPIEPGWWKREPGDFGDQLHWCELCGFCLKTFTRDSAEEVDDMSPSWYERLKALDSPKLKTGRYNIVKIEDGRIAEESMKENKFFFAAMPYIEHYEDRFNALNSDLFAHEFAFASIPDGPGFGRELNRLLAGETEWIVLHSENAALAEDFAEQVGKYILNPGTLHYLDLSKSNDTKFVSNADRETSGYAALFNKRALSLRRFGFDRIAHAESFAEIAAMWQPEKVVELSSGIDEASVLPKAEAGTRYAVWGTGSAGSVAADLIEKTGGVMALAVDKDPGRQGSDFYGRIIQAPKTLTEQSGAYDALVIANFTHVREIEREALELGVPRERVRYLNDFLR